MKSRSYDKTRAVTRRQFVKSSVAITAEAALAWPTIVPRSVLADNAPSKRITIGCIGTGNQGVNNMRGFMENDDVQILAVCDVNTGSDEYPRGRFLGREPARKIVNDFYAKKTRSGNYRACDAYIDFRDVLTRDDIDAVVIVTPDHWHAIMTVMAARAGKDIYCEKPLSLTIAGGRAMVEAVRRYGVILQTGTHHRSKDRIRFVCELVRNGRIGRLKKIITQTGAYAKGPDWEPMPIPEGFDYDMWLGPAPWVAYHKDRCIYKFRMILDYSGGEVTNTGAHSIDIAQWANGTELTGPVEVEDLGGEFPESGLRNTASKVHFRAVFANGVELICMGKGPSQAARFEGSEGWIDCGYSEFKTYPESLKSSVIGP
ncbi:MAG: Gfo/Idh/MocA family oxidoreductase, partial [Planctomycetes bacterium]|nr:Gfo/Idh/MocA family oxidoreductase [Planctomycetota bacterium]